MYYENDEKGRMKAKQGSRDEKFSRERIMTCVNITNKTSNSATVYTLAKFARKKGIFIIIQYFASTHLVV